MSAQLPPRQRAALVNALEGFGVSIAIDTSVQRRDYTIDISLSAPDGGTPAATEANQLSRTVGQIDLVLHDMSIPSTIRVIRALGRICYLPPASPLATPTSSPLEGELTQRDAKLLNLIAQGTDHRQIASELGYSTRHARRLTTDLLTRLGARNRAHAVAIAYAHGLLDS